MILCTRIKLTTGCVYTIPDIFIYIYGIRSSNNLSNSWSFVDVNVFNVAWSDICNNSHQ